MNRNCDQCTDNFKESSTRYWQRLARSSPILCPSCNRISQAEHKAHVRKANCIRDENARKADIIKNGPIVLMRKLKVTYEKAKEIIHEMEEEKKDLQCKAVLQPDE